MAVGRIGANQEAAAALTADPHPLVRQRAMRALRAIGGADQLSAVYTGLTDEENCVRVAAAEALGRLHDDGTPAKLLAAIERDGTLLMKQSCIDSLVEIGELSFHDVIAGLKHENKAVREVCVRALKGLGEVGGLDLYPYLSGIVREAQEDETVRYWSLDSLKQLADGDKLSREEAAAFIAELAELAHAETSTVVQLQAVKILGQLAATKGSDLISSDVIGKVEALFRQYGDGCTRTDAAFGWRAAGNALLAFGEAGSAILERLRAQKQDGWLAWLAYEVVYLPHTKPAFDLCEEERMIADHDRYAPAFPGYRAW
jgi:HEAT repeat protein